MPKGYHHLDRDQRCQLYTLKKRGDSISTIAKDLTVHRSTVYRELSRNKGKRGYRYQQADEKARVRQFQAHSLPRKMATKTQTLINEKLAMQWSPQQIAGWLQKENYEHAISHETIYKYIWKDKRNGGMLYKELRHRDKKYNQRKGAAGRGCIPHRIDISQRPPIVEEKIRLGDWEVDTIIGKGKSGVIVSIVDRASKLVVLAYVHSRTAKAVEDSIIERLAPIKAHVHTITSDNGKEFSAHKNISTALEAEFYFATPYHSWERGLNEHTNGLVRQYFSKSQHFDKITPENLASVESLLNTRPRKALQFATPLERFQQLSGRTFQLSG